VTDDIVRASSLLGPLEARIMRAVWNGELGADFVVRDALAVIPELAYTTVMTTLNRLATKGLLVASRRPGERAHRYRAAGSPRDFIAEATRRRARELVDRFGDSALAAFAAELGEVSPRDMERLRRLRRS
jgi:predicted transcriptional regulator